MEERENLVYQAKLAEQAERYDGKAGRVRTPSRQRSFSERFGRSSPPRGGLGDAGEAFTWISVEGERRQNGGGFLSSLKQKLQFELNGHNEREGAVGLLTACPGCEPHYPANIMLATRC